MAQRLQRRWIGIDITYLAINLIKHRLEDTFGASAKYEIIGAPTVLTDAKTLAVQDPYQFQFWALSLVKARNIDQRKGADQGVDGVIYFHDEADSQKTKQIIISVKAGEHISPSHARDLRGVLERESAVMGALICMEEPTKSMRSEAAGAGFYKSPLGTKHPRLQLLTTADLLRGKQIDYPMAKHSNVTYRKAKAHTEPSSESQQSFFE